MNVIKSVFAVFMLLIIGNSFAQSTGEAMKLLEMKQYNKAKTAFINNLAVQNSIFDLFYLGKIYAMQNQKDSAKLYFEKIFQTDSKSPLTGVSQAIIEISSGNNSQALAILDKTSRYAVSTKDINSLIEIAIAKYQAGDTAGWIIPLGLATNFDRKNSKPYIAAGGIYLLLGEKYNLQNFYIGLASGRYEQALYNEPGNLEALTAQAEILVLSGNFRGAIEYLDKVITADSNYIPALRVYGDLAYTLGKYEKASFFYSRYMALAEYNDKELSRFITILYFNKQYAKANELIIPILAKEPTNAVMLRLKGYTSFELGKYPDGLEAMKKFFALRSSADTNKIISSDYEYTGRLYSRAGNDSLSILYLNKAVDMDSTKAGLLDDIAKSYEKQKKYPEAIVSYNNLVAARKGNVAPAIYFSIGKDFLTLANDAISSADSANRTKYLQSADTAFRKVIELSPNSHLGYQWHGRVAAALDPETLLGLAKPDYEKSLSIIEQKADPSKYKSELMEGYRYLGYYYYLQFESAKIAKDITTSGQAKSESLKYWQKVLDLDLENEVAKQAIKALK